MAVLDKQGMKQLIKENADIEKLRTIQRFCGFPSPAALIEHLVMEDVCPAICLRCDWIEAGEPDVRDGFCPV